MAFPWRALQVGEEHLQNPVSAHPHLHGPLLRAWTALQIRPRRLGKKVGQPRARAILPRPCQAKTPLCVSLCPPGSSSWFRWLSPNCPTRWHSSWSSASSPVRSWPAGGASTPPFPAPARSSLRPSSTSKNPSSKWVPHGSRWPSPAWTGRQPNWRWLSLRVESALLSPFYSFSSQLLWLRHRPDLLISSIFVCFSSFFLRFIGFQRISVRGSSREQHFTLLILFTALVLWFIYPSTQQFIVTVTAFYCIILWCSRPMAYLAMATCQVDSLTF